VIDVRPPPFHDAIHAPRRGKVFFFHERSFPPCSDYPFTGSLKSFSTRLFSSNQLIVQSEAGVPLSSLSPKGPRRSGRSIFQQTSSKDPTTFYSMFLRRDGVCFFFLPMMVAEPTIADLVQLPGASPSGLSLQRLGPDENVHVVWFFRTSSSRFLTQDWLFITFLLQVPPSFLTPPRGTDLLTKPFRRKLDLCAMRFTTFFF